MSTPNLNLTIPASGSNDWDGPMDANLSAIDAGHGVLAAHSKLNVVDMTSNPATPTIDLSLGRIVHLDLSVPVTGSTLVSATDGYITFHITQPVGGNCPFTWPTNVKDGGDISSASGTVTANTVSRQTFAYNSRLGAAYAVTPLVTGAK